MKLNHDVGGATVIWQGKSLFIPLRHIRQHIEGLYAALCLKAKQVYFDEDSVTGLRPAQTESEPRNALLKLIDIADGGMPNNNCLHGKVIDEVTKQFK